MLTFEKAKLYVGGALHHKEKSLQPTDVEAARAYIKDYWHHLVRSHPKDEGSLVGLPFPYLVPSFAEGHEFDYDELFYWDSYFMVQGIWDDEHKQLITGILDDLIYLYNRFKIIPNSSQYYMVGRSQPPFLTSLIMDIEIHYQMDLKWLTEHIEVAKQEYSTVWMGTKKPHVRQVYRGLSRFYDYNYLNDIAETESGWDMTPRFNRKALNYLPVDLNALLYKYETDFARVSRMTHDLEEANKWEAAAAIRKQTMNELMWDKSRGLYYDYDFTRHKRGSVASLAAYYPMWAGMVSEEQAEALVRSLRKFENRGGLATTDFSPSVPFISDSFPMQWAYPNGWAPLQYIVIQALERYGYHQDARRIANKWLSCNLDWFNSHGVFLEKYNVVTPEKPPSKGLYPSQVGFGWTNAIFERLCQDYVDRPV
jgi:alpha,alpha-trehalase